MSNSDIVNLCFTLTGSFSPNKCYGIELTQTRKVDWIRYADIAVNDHQHNSDPTGGKELLCKAGKKLAQFLLKCSDLLPLLNGIWLDLFSGNRLAIQILRESMSKELDIKLGQLITSDAIGWKDQSSLPKKDNLFLKLSAEEAVDRVTSFDVLSILSPSPSDDPEVCPERDAIERAIEKADHNRKQLLVVIYANLSGSDGSPALYSFLSYHSRLELVGMDKCSESIKQNIMSIMFEPYPGIKLLDDVSTKDIYLFVYNPK
jgi:hypothetical protein